MALDVSISDDGRRRHESDRDDKAISEREENLVRPGVAHLVEDAEVPTRRQRPGDRPDTVAQKLRRNMKITMTTSRKPSAAVTASRLSEARMVMGAI